MASAQAKTRWGILSVGNIAQDSESILLFGSVLSKTLVATV